MDGAVDDMSLMCDDGGIEQDKCVFWIHKRCRNGYILILFVLCILREVGE